MPLRGRLPGTMRRERTARSSKKESESFECRDPDKSGISTSIDSTPSNRSSDSNALESAQDDTPGLVVALDDANLAVSAVTGSRLARAAR